MGAEPPAAAAGHWLSIPHTGYQSHMERCTGKALSKRKSAGAQHPPPRSNQAVEGTPAGSWSALRPTSDMPVLAPCSPLHRTTNSWRTTPAFGASARSSSTGASSAHAMLKGARRSSSRTPLARCRWGAWWWHGAAGWCNSGCVGVGVEQHNPCLWPCCVPLAHASKELTPCGTTLRPWAGGVVWPRGRRAGR